MYKVENEELVLLPCLVSDFIKNDNEYELVKASGGQKYYLQTIEAFDKYKKIIDWMVKNYAHIKIALHMIKSDVAGKKLEGMHLLGSVSMVFSKCFPDKSMYDLKSLIESFDKSLELEFNKA